MKKEQQLKERNTKLHFLMDLLTKECLKAFLKVMQIQEPKKQKIQQQFVQEAQKI
jgi:hypothetical protein